MCTFQGQKALWGWGSKTRAGVQDGQDSQGAEVTSGMEYERPSSSFSVQDIKIIIIPCFHVPGEDGTLHQRLNIQP